MNKFVKAARYVLRSRMVKKATQDFKPYDPAPPRENTPLSQYPESTHVYPYDIDYDPVLGRTSDRKFVPYKRGKELYRAQPFKRTLMDITPNMPQEQYPYTQIDNQRMSNNFTDKLHKRLFGLPADTQSILRVDQDTARDNWDIHNKNVANFESLPNPDTAYWDYYNWWNSNIIRQLPATNTARENSSMPYAVPDDDQIEAGVIPLDYDNNGRPIYGQMPVIEAYQALEMLKEKQYRTQQLKENYMRSVQDDSDPYEDIKDRLKRSKRYVINRRKFYDGTDPWDSDSILPQKHKVMQQYIDRSNVAKRFARNPSLLNAALYYGYKSSPYLWPSNWKQQNQKAFNKTVDFIGSKIHSLRQQLETEFK